MAHFEGCRIGAELELTVVGKTWAARLDGLDEEFGFDRTFLRYAEKRTAKSSRVVTAFYPVEDGLFESQQGRGDRCYWRVEGGRIQKISIDEARAELEGVVE